VLERDPANSRPAQGLIPLAALATALLPARLTGLRRAKGFINSMLRSLKVIFSNQKVKEKDRECTGTLYSTHGRRREKGYGTHKRFKRAARALLHPQKGTLQRRFEFGGSGGLEQLGKWKPAEHAGEEVVKLEKVLLEGVEPPKEPVDVIVGSEIVGLIVHESCGHPSEADRILGREAAQAGMSFIKPGMLGQRIGSEHATVIDDPTIPGSYGFYLYDDEGVPARARAR
jgi:predicted Zn-dependent protease